MRHCPICHTTDNNLYGCDACGYKPALNNAEEEKEDQDPKLKSQELRELGEEASSESEAAEIKELEEGNPEAKECPVCHNQTFISHEGSCLWCGYCPEEDDEALADEE